MVFRPSLIAKTLIVETLLYLVQRTPEPILVITINRTPADAETVISDVVMLNAKSPGKTVRRRQPPSR